VHRMRMLAPKIGDTFLIVGAGKLGLMLLQLALRGGASRVSMLDLNAECLGATATTTNLDELLGNELLGFDCVIDATGVPAAIEGAFDAVKRGGKLLVFGVDPEEARVALSPFRIYNDEITVLGSMAVLNSFGPAVDLVASGAVDAEALLTQALPRDEYPGALDIVRRDEGLKMQILPNG
jgi:threonine dehydrogenase-like Zn-dependent dehydrogenase